MFNFKKKSFFSYYMEDDDTKSDLRRETLKNDSGKSSDEDFQSENFSETLLKNFLSATMDVLPTQSPASEKKERIKKLLKFKNKRDESVHKPYSSFKTSNKPISSSSHLKVSHDESIDLNMPNSSKTGVSSFVDTDLTDNNKLENSGSTDIKKNIIVMPTPSKAIISAANKVNKKFVTSDGTYFCLICSYETKYITHFERHMKDCHPEMHIFQCEICEYETKSKSYLTVHTLNHLGIKPYKCSLCGYASTRRDYLNLHMKSHSRNQTFRCLECNYTTYRDDYLHRHVTTKHSKKI